MAIGDGNVITGTSKYIASWDAAGFDPDNGTNYVAIHAQAATGYRITAQAVPTQGTTSAYFTNDDAVLQITDATTAIRLTCYTSSGTDALYSVDYPLNMTLETE